MEEEEGTIRQSPPPAASSDRLSGRRRWTRQETGKEAAADPARRRNPKGKSTISLSKRARMGGEMFSRSVFLHFRR